MLFLRPGFILTFLVSSPKTASALGGRVVPAPSPHLASIWRLLGESVCSLAWPSWPFYLFFINHPLPPPDSACPAPLNRLQFVSSEWCRALPARPGVAVLRLEGKEGPSPICSQAPLPADPRLCWVLLAVAQVVSLLNSHSAFISRASCSSARWEDHGEPRNMCKLLKRISSSAEGAVG